MKAFSDRNPKPSGITPPQFHFVSNRRVTFDGRFEITAYTDDYIILRSPSLSVKIFGSGLTVGEFGGDEAQISGIFVKIEFS